MRHQLDAMDDISSTWQEAAEAAEAERAKLQSDLTALRGEHTKISSQLARAQKRLAQMEVSGEAWREASAASNSELALASAQAETRAEAKAKLLTSKADMANRDVASLRAQQLLSSVHTTTLGRELEMLDGIVGFLAARLAATREELAGALELQGQLRGEADESRRAAMLSRLELQRMDHVVAALRRTTDDLRTHVTGAQVWANEAEASYDETLGAIRIAAGEQLNVQAKRLRAWDEDLELIISQSFSDKERVHGLVAQVRELLTSERKLIAEQTRLYSEGMRLREGARSAVLQERLEAVELELEAQGRTKVDLDGEIALAARQELETQLAAALAELTTTKGRLRAQEDTMSKMNDWFTAQIAVHRTAFDKAVDSFVDQASRLSVEGAEALDKAATASRLEAAALADGRSADASRRPSLMGDRRRVSYSIPDAPEGAGGAEDAAADAGTAGGGKRRGSSEAMLSEISRLRSRMAELEETLRFTKDESARAATRDADAHRREIADATRWAAQLETQLEHTTASLEIERTDNARLEAQLQAQVARLGEAEDRAQRSSPAHSPARAPRAAWSAAGEAGAAQPGTAPAPGGPELLRVGSLARYEDATLRTRAPTQSPQAPQQGGGVKPAGGARARRQHFPSATLV